MIEYLEDLIETNPQEEFPADVQATGLFVHRTGDKLIDKWQEKSARGEVIDFSEAFTTDESKKAFEAIKEKSRKKFQARHGGADVKPAVEAVPEEAMPEGFHDDYKGGL